jgi:hypothetical protein
VTGHTTDDLRAELEAIGARLAAADEARASAMTDLRRVARAAHAGDLVPIKHIAELAGVTRPTIYKLLED